MLDEDQVMADPGVENQAEGPVGQGPALLGAAFEGLAQEVKNVTTILGCQGASQIIKSFDGNPKEYREWVKSVEKYQVMMNVSENDCNIIAYQTSRGPVGGFIQRHLKENVGETWANLKKELAKRFSDVTDQHVALTLLRQTKQKPNENVQLYAERIMSLAEDGYDDNTDDQIQKQLVDIFVNGLTNDQLRLTILRKNPESLRRAVDIATTEFNLKYRIAVASGQSGQRFQFSAKPYNAGGHSSSSQGHEPMEVDSSRSLRCFKCKRRGHRAKDCKAVRAVNVICFACGQEGHMAGDCKNPRKQITCFKCGKKGHIAPDCWGNNGPRFRGKGQKQGNQETVQQGRNQSN